MGEGKGHVKVIVRLYSGEDGQSHFEDLSIPVGDVENIALRPGGEMQIRKNVEERFGDWHTTGRRHYVIVLSGNMEIGIGDGTVRRLGPGDVLLPEDMTGRGHTSRLTGSPYMSVHVPLPD